jgi:DNA-binding response OmpR family regulator
MPQVLAADDSRLMADLRASALGRSDVRVRRLHAGDDVVEHAVRTDARAVLLTDGEGCPEPLASCRAIRGDARTSGVPVVFVGSWITRSACRRAGVDLFVPRFAPLHELGRAISRVVGLAERAVKRWPVDLACRIELPRRVITGRCLDLSIAGCRIEMTERPEFGEEILQLELELGDRRVRLSGRVRRETGSTLRGWGAGIAFARRGPARDAELSRLVRRAAERRRGVEVCE